MDKASKRETSHYGLVLFQRGIYQRVGGSSNWSVTPIPGFDPPIQVPLGQVRIEFTAPQAGDYIVLLTAHRTPGAPMLMANYGDADKNGFVVHLFEPVATRTLQNGGFSFWVLPAAGLGAPPELTKGKAERPADH